MWQAVYVNIHVCCRFDVDVPGGPVLQESKSTAPGMTFVVCGPSHMLYGYCVIVCFGNFDYGYDFSVTGSEVVVASSPIGRLGLTVCYDLRFPELYQELRFKKDAEVFFQAIGNPNYLFFTSQMHLV